MNLAPKSPTLQHIRLGPLMSEHSRVSPDLYLHPRWVHAPSLRQQWECFDGSPVRHQSVPGQADTYTFTSARSSSSL